MDSEKYIGLDVHQATIVVAVMDSAGKLVMESILETKAATILQFFAGWRGTLWVTFEEGTWSAWLYDLLNPHYRAAVVFLLTECCASWRRRFYPLWFDSHQLIRALLPRTWKVPSEPCRL